MHPGHETSLDSRRHGPPFTPPMPGRAPIFDAADEGPPESWRGRRPPTSRRRFPQHHPWRSPPRRSGGRYRSPPKWKPYWSNPPNQKRFNSSPNLGPMLQSLSVHDEWRGRGRTNSRKKYPMTVSPKTRERSFTDIMNGAFDLAKSPMSLGRKLSKPTQSGQFFHHSLDEPDSDTETPMMVCPDPAQAGRKVASSSEGSPFVKLPRSALASSSSEENDSVPSLSPATETTHQDQAVTVGFGLLPTSMPPDQPELDLLLKMMRRNTEQSKKMTDLITKLMEKTSSKSQETAPVKGEINQLPVKQLNDGRDFPAGPQVATLAGGGDSPPHNASNPFRGHMIDRLDFDMGGTTSIDNSVLSPKCASETTTGKSASGVDELRAQRSPAPPPSQTSLSQRANWSPSKRPAGIDFDGPTHTGNMFLSAEPPQHPVSPDDHSTASMRSVYNFMGQLRPTFAPSVGSLSSLDLDSTEPPAVEHRKDTPPGRNQQQEMSLVSDQNQSSSAGLRQENSNSAHGALGGEFHLVLPPEQRQDASLVSDSRLNFALNVYPTLSPSQSPVRRCDSCGTTSNSRYGSGTSH